jgi:predicted molibdopterin-dependent oxidoreductase YjgC
VLEVNTVRLMRGKSLAAAYFDLERHDSIELQSAAGAIRIPVRADEGVMAGTVVVPHGLPGTNVNRLTGSDHSLIERLSGMHRMIGHRVVLRTLRPSVAERPSENKIDQSPS